MAQEQYLAQPSSRTAYISQDWSLLTQMVTAAASAAQLARSGATTCHREATSTGCSLLH